MSKIYLLSNKEYSDVINLEVFKIEYIKSLVDFSKYDALIFTSKNAVYSLESFNIKWKNIPSYVIAPKTAQIVKQKGGTISFIGKTSHGNEFAKELIPKLQNKKVLYVKALKTVSNLVEILIENGIDLTQTVVYKTICNKKLNTSLEKDSIFIFTSPSSIKCFFKNYDWNNSFRAICIGKTTAKYMPNNIDYTVSKKTSIEECIKIAKKMIF